MALPDLARLKNLSLEARQRALNKAWEQAAEARPQLESIATELGLHRTAEGFAPAQARPSVELWDAAKPAQRIDEDLLKKMVGEPHLFVLRSQAGEESVFAGTLAEVTGSNDLGLSRWVQLVFDSFHHRAALPSSPRSAASS
jgi:hypothetical protein